LSELVLLSRGEREQLLVDWNHTQYQWDSWSVTEMFEQQVERTPSALALQCGSQQLSYQELNQRAERLARRLRAGGVQPDAIVGVMVERSVEMVEAVLGILKAGGAYLPLDPAYPQERLSYMLADAEVSVVVTQEELVARLPGRGCQMVLVGTEPSAQSAGAEQEREAAKVEQENLIYVIYTSGSTGKPKGVGLTHRMASNLIRWHQETMACGLKTLQFASLSFDASFHEVFAALSTGGSLHILSEQQRRDPESLSSYILAHGIEKVILPVVVLQQLAELNGDEPVRLRSLKEVTTTGEQMHLTRPIKELFGKLSGCRLHNHYGPSETHVVTSYTLTEEAEQWESHPPIGKPIYNTEIYVLDKGMCPVPIGVRGELYIGGENVGRCYLKRPELTAEKFIPNPYGECGGERLYRTGDIARYLSDGTIEYLGRKDEQVKIRGHRVELGEIESVLSGQGSVREAVVVAREDEPGEKRLVAYVVLEESADVTAVELRKYVQSQLPDYMVPGAFIRMAELPLNSNGKVDRRKLPQPVREDHDKRPIIAPRNPLEEVMAEIWAGVLRVERVGVEDNFFDLGGQSLLATQVVSRLRNAFGVELPLRALFESPTIADLACTIESLSRGAQESALFPESIAPVRRDSILPLSFAQQRLWVTDQIELQGSAYNLFSALHLIGNLDQLALERTFSEIVNRHEVLRTTFQIVENQPAQIINLPFEVKIPLKDLSHLPEAQRLNAAREIAADEADQPFDLKVGPLLRLSLLRLGDQEHILLFSMHHIISDGWSLGILVREIAALYPAFAQGREASLPPLPLQYADYAVWQRTWLQGEVFEKQLQYWKRQLEDIPSLVTLPSDWPRPQLQTFKGASFNWTLEPDLCERIRRFNQREGVTLYMTVLAAYGVLIWRYTGLKDLVVGTPIANRNRLETEGLIGFFVNILALRLKLSERAGFRELLRQVRELTLAAYAHQDLPFERLVEELQPVRSLSHSPIFQMTCAVHNLPQEELELEGLKMVALEEFGEAAKFDLSLSFFETGRQLSGNIVYNTALYDRETIEQFSKQLQEVMAEAVANADRQVAQLGLLNADLRKQVLVEWNRTGHDYERDATIGEVFELQAECRPAASALESQGQQLSYAELNERANQLAHHLVSLGVGPEAVVGVMVERSVEMVVGILAILKAGGAYLPLDPELPLERLSYMLERSGGVVILTEEKFSDALPAQFGQHVISLDQEWEQFRESYSRSNPVRRAEADNAAYVMYTSGSTGEPKGVVVTHRNVLRLVRSVEYVELGAEEVFLQLAPISFDASTFELWGSLLNGGKLALMPSGKVGLEEIGQELRSQGVTTLWLTAGLFHQMVEEQIEALHSVRQLLAGGEALNPRLVERYLQSAGDQNVLINGYGPTEGTTFSCCQQLRGPWKQQSSVPIGSAIGNTEVYVLESEMEPVGIGMIGELYIGGEGLARGYLGSPEMTAEKFVPNPYGGRAGSRLYRSGDLVRYSPDGQLKFIGRADQQVKLRGYRIELGEIEAALSSHPQVGQAVAVLKGEDADKRIIGYVVPRDFQSPISQGELREHVRNRLPDYMTPSAIVALEQIPLTVNGKVDRSKLPDPERENNREIRQLTGFTEQLLGGIWRKVLGLETVGAGGDFFELGGHSLLATQLVSRIGEVFGVRLPLRKVFEHSRIEELAREIEEARGASRGLEAIAGEIQRRADKKKRELSYAQQRLWFLDQFEPGNAFYNVPLGVRIEGDLDENALRASLVEVIRRHEVLRTRFEVEDGRAIQVIYEQPEFEWEQADLRGLAEEDREQAVRQYVTQSARKPFDLRRGGLLRVGVLRLEQEQYVVQMTIHHIVSDGWSLGVLVREMVEFYQACREGRQSRLEDLKIQYGDYAEWQREWLTGETLGQQLTYWKEQLTGAPARLELPTDRMRGAVQRYRGEDQGLCIAQPQTLRLKQLSADCDATLYMALLGAFGVLLSKYSGETDLVIGSPIANRNRGEIEGLIGFFVNTLAMRVRINPAASFRELLAEIREISLAAYDHQDLPFEKLVEELQPERALSHSPIFQVMFVLQNAPHTEFNLPSLKISAVNSEIGTAKFSLNLNLGEYEQQLIGSLEYDADLFEAATIQRMVGHFQDLIRKVLDAPDQALSDLALITEQEEYQVLREWNQTEMQYPRELCLQQLWEQQVLHSPGAVALSYRDLTLTYDQVNEEANRLAQRLLDLKLGTAPVVGVLLTHSPLVAVGLLAVLKTGGAYLPLDPQSPAERWTWMIRDAGALALITEPAFEALLKAQELKTSLVVLDGQCPPVSEAEVSTPNPQANVWPESGAYLMYTSGSTGRPKGVMVPHRGVVNCLCWMQREYALNQTDRFLAKGSLGFDASVWEWFWPLITGGQVVIVPEEDRYDLPAQVRLMKRKGVTIAYYVPTLLEIFSKAPGLEELESLRYLISGGEALQAETARRVLKRCGGKVELHHSYGPTEASIAASEWTYQPEADRRLPIGKALGNTQLYVLDERLNAIPIGVVGELYIGGEGLAQGYLNQPGLTAERFIPNPNAQQPGERLYRTGDCVRYRNDGNLEFIGRQDRQIKIRGIRVELEEIEQVLQGQEGVSKAMVIAQEDRRGDKRLVAYVVVRKDADLAMSELRQRVREQLPEYLTPSRIIQLERLPLTDGGKLDRNKLPEWVPEAETDQYLAPETETERRLARIWEEVLGLERVSVRDNFFELGGHSLLATQVVSRARSEMEVEIPLRELFNSATVRDMARWMETRQREEQMAREELDLFLTELEQMSPEETQQLLNLEVKEQA